MFYRENGQFKTSYRADQQVFPIAQDRIAIALLLAVAFLVVPMLATDYFYRAILIPLVIMSMAALGVNILVGYCGQISLGSVPSWPWVLTAPSTSSCAFRACHSSPR
jgi:amino acid/amide ABC transporter membrane protein 2, HAAT family (TC 3.A.1.4.-)